MPAEPHAVTDLPAIVGLHAGGVLLESHEPHAAAELDDHLGGGPHVDALGDRALDRDHALLQLVDPDLLRAHGKLDLRALRAVRWDLRLTVLAAAQAYAAVLRDA